MFDDRIIALARRTAAVQLKDLDEPLARAIGGIQAKMGSSGARYVYTLDRYQLELAHRAEIIWRNLHRAHGTRGSPYSDDLRSALLKAFREDLDALVTHLSPRFEQDMKEAPKSAKERSWNAKFGDARDRELARYEAEIEHYVSALETARERGKAPEASYIVHGNVGAIVTGAGASANVVQNIGTDQREALLKALGLVKEAIGGTPEIVDRDRRELIDLADEASVEIVKEQPNGKRLSLALQSLASAVQGIASGPGAYEVLRSAAAAIGIQI